MDAQRRHHRERVIARQQRIVRFATGGEFWRKPGYLTKQKAFKCSCPMCTSHVQPLDTFELAAEFDAWGIPA